MLGGDQEFTFSCSPALKAALESAADATGRTVSELVSECLDAARSATIHITVTEHTYRNIRLNARMMDVNEWDYVLLAVESWLSEFRHRQLVSSPVDSDVAAFVDECCERGSAKFALFADLWLAYSGAYGGLTKRQFAAELQKLGFESGRRYIDGATQSIRTGLGLKC